MVITFGENIQRELDRLRYSSKFRKKMKLQAPLVKAMLKRTGILIHSLPLTKFYIDIPFLVDAIKDCQVCKPYL